MKYIFSTKQQKSARWNKINNSYAGSSKIDYSLHPEKYRVVKGEQAVLYKLEILPYFTSSEGLLLSIKRLNYAKRFNENYLFKY